MLNTHRHKGPFWSRRHCLNHSPDSAELKRAWEIQTPWTAGRLGPSHSAVTFQPPAESRAQCLEPSPATLWIYSCGSSQQQGPRFWKWLQKGPFPKGAVLANPEGASSAAPRAWVSSVCLRNIWPMERRCWHWVSFSESIPTGPALPFPPARGPRTLKLGHCPARAQQDSVDIPGSLPSSSSLSQRILQRCPRTLLGARISGRPQGHWDESVPRR